MVVGRSQYAALAIGLFACSESADGDRGGESAQGSSNAPSDDTPLGKLTAQQRQSLCAELDEAEEPIVDAFEEELCTWQAHIAQALGVATCESFRTTCLADEDDEGEEGAEEEEDEEDDCAVTEKTTCTNVTVKDVKECNEALIKRDRDAAESIRESKLTCEDEFPEALQPEVPANCKALIAKCSTLDIEEEVD